MKNVNALRHNDIAAHNNFAAPKTHDINVANLSYDPLKEVGYGNKGKINGVALAQILAELPYASATLKFTGEAVKWNQVKDNETAPIKRYDEDGKLLNKEEFLKWRDEVKPEIYKKYQQPFAHIISTIKEQIAEMQREVNELYRKSPGGKKHQERLTAEWKNDKEAQNQSWSLAAHLGGEVSGPQASIDMAGKTKDEITKELKAAYAGTGFDVDAAVSEVYAEYESAYDDIKKNYMTQ